MTTHKRSYRDAARARVLGDRLRARARELDMKYVRLAAKSNVPYKTLMNYLDGKRTPDLFTLGKIAAALKTSPDALQTGQAFLPSGDPQTFSAQTLLLESLPELRDEDLLLIADVVTTLQNRRLDERRSARLSPVVFDRLQQIYRELIPRIIQEHAPLHLAMDYETQESGQVTFYIACTCGPGIDPAGCRQMIGQYLQHKLKVGRRTLIARDDGSDIDMEFQFLLGPRLRDPNDRAPAQ